MDVPIAYGCQLLMGVPIAELPKILPTGVKKMNWAMKKDDKSYPILSK